METSSVDNPAEEPSPARKRLYLKFQRGNNDCARTRNSNSIGIAELPLKPLTPIEPPLEFRDQRTSPNRQLDKVEHYCDTLATDILSKAFSEYRDGGEVKPCPNPTTHRTGRPFRNYTTEFLSFSPCHRPNSRSSLVSSRLSSSHNSLSVPNASQVDDSNFITQAVSHDTLDSRHINDIYNVPFDSDMYAVPVDVVKHVQNKVRRSTQANKARRRRNTSSGLRDVDGVRQYRTSNGRKSASKSEKYPWCLKRNNSSIKKRHSFACTSSPIEGEPIHMTLQEVRHYLQTLYSNSSDSSENLQQPFTNNNNNNSKKHPLIIRRQNANNEYGLKSSLSHNNNKRESCVVHPIMAGRAKKTSTFLINIKNKKVKDSSEHTISKSLTISAANHNKEEIGTARKLTKSGSARFVSFKQALCNMFRFSRFLSGEHVRTKGDYIAAGGVGGAAAAQAHHLKEERHLSSRALPPLPGNKREERSADGKETSLDFATSIQRVKDYGWYWGPLPSEMAEKILSNEPDGSFIVRDSSDDHHIFSLTFKLNNCIRHVRIDHDQGNFSFGNCTIFKSQTIVEFIENAVEHSRSGRYLFFLHRRPVIGPVRVQLLHPVSRFKQVQSLQHICRFVIHKVVRRDLIHKLPLPRRMIDYLNTPHYYSEHLIDVEDIGSEPPPRIPTPAIRRDLGGDNNSAPAIVPLNNLLIT